MAENEDVPDTQTHEATNAAEVREEINLEQHREALKELRQTKEVIAKRYHNRTVVKVFGAVAAAFGSILGIVGFALAFFTFGASHVLTVGGGVIAAAGSITMAGSDFGEWTLSRKQMKKAKAIVEQEGERFVQIYEGVSRHKKYPSETYLLEYASKGK